MERWVLAICFDKTKFDCLQQEWLKHDIYLHITSDFLEAVTELSKANSYLLIIVFEARQDYFSLLNVMRKITAVPILIVSWNYDSAVKTVAIEAGADEYIALSEDYLAETIASGRALIRRYTELNRADIKPPNILLRGSLFISADYRKVFVHTKEIALSRREFHLLYFLASNPGRVFTNEELYREVWGENYLESVDGGLQSCLKRIRRKLEAADNDSCYIKNLRGVGYCFMQDDT